MRIVKLFHRLNRYADTPNKFNRLRIELENRMTPLELAALTADAGPYLGRADEDDDDEDDGKSRRERRKMPPATLAEWCARLTRTSGKSGKVVPEPFQRRRALKDAWFFSSGGDTKSKVLCLCFNSSARRMMMALPIFLQHLDASLVDVVLFRNEAKDGFRRCFTDDENNLEKQIPKIANLGDYRGAVAIGMSGGGLPAVLVAMGLGLDAVMSVGGNDPNDERWITPDGDGADLVRRYLAATGGKLPDIYLLYSLEYSRDANAAKSLSAMVSAREIAYYVPKLNGNGNRPVRHGVTQPIVFREIFCSLLNATLFSRFDPARTGVEEDWSKFMSGPTLV